jgi:hypothetical protein
VLVGAGRGGRHRPRRTCERFREHDEKLLRDQYLVYDDEAAVIQTSRDARADLMHLFEADAESDGKTADSVASPIERQPGRARRYPRSVA